MLKFLLRKMKGENPWAVKYTLLDEKHPLLMNQLIGQTIKIEHTGVKICWKCKNQVKELYRDGLCKKCYYNSPQSSECIFKPEMCKGSKCKDEKHSAPHVVYLALTSHPKIGVTVKTSRESRWIDQGAWKAVVIAETPTRRLAGEIESALKFHVSDRTNWQRMLKNQMDKTFDLAALKAKMHSMIPDNLREFIVDFQEIIEINYPVQSYPEKVKSFNLEKAGEICGLLMGIRGQYLIFDHGRVINIRRLTGYEVELSW